jgi:predicted nucleic acid-binding protein
MRNFTASEGVFVDTWAWLVLANRKDPNYPQVRDLRVASAERGVAWITTDYVLDETATRLFASVPFSAAAKFFDGIFESQQLESVVIETINPDRFRAAWKLRLKYKDKPRISFTDLTSFVVMRERRIRRVITGDSHFGQVGLGFQAIP